MLSRVIAKNTGNVFFETQCKLLIWVMLYSLLANMAWPVIDPSVLSAANQNA